ncbi:MAG: flagellar biosynthesis protein FliQ [Spirochaetaceae bacterium]|nr:flagellar biosynthesis protein FliQ [Spirochaetaceae bacterium]
MTLGAAATLARDAVLQLLVLAAPMLVASVVVGLAVSIVQAATSIHEQTLSFVPKIFAVIGVALLLGPWLGASMVDYTTRLFESIPALGAMP